MLSPGSGALLYQSRSSITEHEFESHSQRAHASGCGSVHGSLYVVHQASGFGGGGRSFLHAVPNPITGLHRGRRFGLGFLMNEASEGKQSDSGFKAVHCAQDDG